MKQANVIVTLRKNGGSLPQTISLDWAPRLRQEIPGYPGWTVFKVEFPLQKSA